MKRDQGHKKGPLVLHKRARNSPAHPTSPSDRTCVSHWFKHATWCREGRQGQFLSGIQIFSLSLLVIPWVPEVFSRV